MSTDSSTTLRSSSLTAAEPVSQAAAQPGQAGGQATPGGLDRLSGLLEHFRVAAHLIAAATLRFPRTYGDAGTAGHLHVLRAGELVVAHPEQTGLEGRITLSEPTVLLYPSAVPHRFEPVARAEVACASLEFSHGSEHPLVRALPRLVQLPIAQIDGLGPALELLFAETDHVRCGHRLLADRLLEVVLIQVLRWLLDHPGQAGIPAGLAAGFADDRIAAALVAIHEAPGETWTLEQLARRAAMSRSAFAARFHELVGQTPASYVADWRILLAQSRLRDGETVAAIASDLGYANASGLSRVFSARTGQSPREWLSAARA